MVYALSAQSNTALFRVHPLLVRCVQRAIRLSSQDFVVFEGLRSEAQQIANVAKQVSWTTNSKHLAQRDGFAHAVDLVPMHDGGPRWEWPLIYPVAWAMKQASEALGLQLRWGGVWDRTLSGLGNSPEALRDAVGQYCVRHAGPDKLDGPHYEVLELPEETLSA